MEHSVKQEEKTTLCLTHTHQAPKEDVVVG